MYDRKNTGKWEKAILVSGGFSQGCHGAVEKEMGGIWQM